jgi:hypothetical protein
MAIPSTRDRVPEHTSASINEAIREKAAADVRRVAAQPSLIASRLQELDDEWDIERAIEANASTLAFIGVALGYFVHPYWLALPALVTAFLFQHAVQGWCPPVPVLRRLGFRTVHEIEEERQALKAIRGDYDQVSTAPDKTTAALRAARLT